jgi:hypothetical protein
MKSCVNKNTVIYVFCSTIYKDSNWIEIRKYFEKKDMEINCFTSIFEDGQDQLKNLIDTLSSEAQNEEGKDEDEEPEDRCEAILEKLKSGGGVIKFSKEDEDGKPCKPRKPKHRAPEYMIIFDDLSGELKSKTLVELLKKNRHFKSKIIISSQWLHDLLPESRKQIDLFLIFKGFPDEKVLTIWKDCDSSVPFDVFLEVYKNATVKPFSFLYIDSRADKFRQNFNHEFILNPKN